MPSGYAENDLDRAVRRLCLAFPESAEEVGHGMAQYRIQGGRTFATYARNHHGDGRIALWLCAPSGMQDLHVRAEPRHFFVPPYVGPRGWLGVRLDTGLPWKRVAAAVRAAYEHVAPATLARQLGETPAVAAPKRRITAADIDPANTARGRKVLAGMRKVCLDLPETAEDAQFGSPVWRAGRRVFAKAWCQGDRWRVSFWVGVDRQWIYTPDPRFSIPAYTGHLGWIELDVAKSHRDSELRTLALQSYRHFAPARLLARLPPE